MSVLYPDLGLTTFPNTNDTFINFANISESDAPLVQQFQTAFQSGDFATASQILTQIPNATAKIVTAQAMNKLAQAILATERFFKTDIQPYLLAQQQQWEALINNFSYLGSYVETTQYVKNNIVAYAVGGQLSLYLCTVTPPSTNYNPTATTYWRLFTIKGETGEQGVGMTWMGEWSNTTAYVVDNMVTFGNNIWGCLVANINTPPTIGSVYWQQLMDNSSVQYPVSQQPPTAPSVNDLWFREVGAI